VDSSEHSPLLRCKIGIGIRYVRVEKHLSFWQDLDVKAFNSWCGSPDTSVKASFRDDICKKGYKSVLDVGAGIFSEYYGFLADGHDIEYTATEITQKYIEIGEGSGIKVKYGSVEDLPFEDNSFDSILCNDVLNHQLSFQASISELLRVARHRVYISFFKPFLEDLKLTPEWQSGDHLFQQKQVKFKKFNYVMKIDDKVVTDTRLSAQPGQLIYNPLRYKDSSEAYVIKLWETLGHPEATKEKILSYVLPAQKCAYTLSPIVVSMPAIYVREQLVRAGLGHLPMPGEWYDADDTPGFPRALFKNHEESCLYNEWCRGVGDIGHNGWGIHEIKDGIASVVMRHSYWGKDIHVAAEIVDEFVPAEYAINDEVITIPVEISNSCQTTCVHSYFSKQSLIKFLDKCQIKYRFDRAKNQADMLILEKE
jgi:SAM-dependent methyltransferase